MWITTQLFVVINRLSKFVMHCKADDHAMHHRIATRFIAPFEGAMRKIYGSFEIRVGYATCGLRREKSSLPAIRKMTVRMVSSRV